MLSEFENGDTLLSLLKQKTSKLNFDLKDISQDEEGKNWFRAILISDTGEKCETEDFLDALPEMLVGIDLIDIQKEDLMKSARKSPYFNAGMDRAYRL